jgi:hypothetical protein
MQMADANFTLSPAPARLARILSLHPPGTLFYVTLDLAVDPELASVEHLLIQSAVREDFIKRGLTCRFVAEHQGERDTWPSVHVYGRVSALEDFLEAHGYDRSRHPIRVHTGGAL